MSMPDFKLDLEAIEQATEARNDAIVNGLIKTMKVLCVWPAAEAERELICEKLSEVMQFLR